MSRILIVPDVPGWAWDRRAHGIKKYAPAGVDVDVYYATQAPANLRQYDAVLWFEWPGYTGNWPNVWGHAASEGCLHEYKRPPSDFYPQRVASKMNNRTAAARSFRRFARGVITVNPKLEEPLRKWNANVKLLPTGVDCGTFRPSDSPRPPGKRLRVGWCGKLTVGDKLSCKGYEEIVVPLMERVGSFCDLDANTRVWTDALDGDGMREWYNSLDVFLVTSCCEGTPSVLLEAMACGVHCVATPVGIVEDVRSKEPLPVHVTPGWSRIEDTPAVVGDMATYLSWLNDHRYDLGQRGRIAGWTVLEYYDWDSLAEVWVETLLEG